MAREAMQNDGKLPSVLVSTPSPMLATARRVRPVIAASGAALLLVLAGLVALPADREIRRRIAAYTIDLGASFLKLTGYSIAYESLSPSILGGLGLRQLRITDAEGRRVLEARRVSLRYDLWALIRHRGDPFITGIALEGATASIARSDLDRLRVLFGSRDGSASQSIVLPRLVLDAKDLQLELPDLLEGGLVIDARKIGIDTTKVEPEISLAGTASARVPGLGPLSSVLVLAGSFSPKLDAVRLRATASATASSFTLSTQDIDLAFAKGVIEVRKVRDSAPIDLYGRYVVGSRDLSVNLRCVDFRPETLFVPGKGLAFIAPWFHESWTGLLTLELPGMNTSLLSFDGDLEGRIPDSVDGGDWKVRVSALGTPEAFTVRSARAEGKLGTFAFSGSLRRKDLLVKGEFSADARPLGGRLPIVGAVMIDGMAGDYSARSAKLSVAGVVFRDLALGLKIRDELYTASLAFLLPTKDADAAIPVAPAINTAASPEVTLAGVTAAMKAKAARDHRFELEGSWSRKADGIVECGASWDLLELRAITPLLGFFMGKDLIDRLSPFELGGGVQVQSDLTHVSWSTTNLTITSGDLPGGAAIVSASGRDSDITIRKAQIAWKDYKTELSGTLAILPKGDVSFETSILYSGIPYALKGTWNGSILKAAGDYGLNLTGRFYDGSITASVSLESMPVPIKDLPLALTCAFDIRFRDSSDWNLSVQRLEVQPSSRNFGMSPPEVTLAGTFGPEGGSISAASVADAFSKVQGSGSLVLAKGGREGEIKLHLAGTTAESYELDASYAEGLLKARLDCTSSPLVRVVKDRLFGVVDGSLTVSGALDRLEGTWQATLRSGKLDGSPIVMSVNGAFAPGNFALSEGHVLWRGYEVTGLATGLDLDGGAGTMTGHFHSKTTLSGMDFNFALALASRASSTHDFLAKLSDCRYEGQFTDFVFQDMKTASWPFFLDISSKGLFIKGGLKNEFALSLLADGSISAKTTNPFAFTVDLKGRIRGLDIDLEAKGLGIDMKVLSNLVGGLPVIFEGGRLSGDVLIRGNGNDPDFSGAMRLDDCKLSLPGWISEVAGPISAPIVADGKRLLLSVPSVPIHNSNFALTLELIFDQWVPTDIRIGMRSLASTIVPIETKILGVTIKGFAVPNLDLRIMGSVLSVKGKLELRKTDITVTPETLAGGVEATQAPSSLLDIDLGISFAKSVRVFFPDRNYPIIAGNTEPSSHLSVRYDQAREDMSVKGEVLMRGGEAFYIQRNFFLRSAKLVFNESSNKPFDPLVSMRAELRDSTAEGPIIVTLRADSVPVASFKPRLTSVPPKSESDIALLLGQNLLGVADGGDLNLANIAISGMDFVPQLNLTKAFEASVREALNLDVFYIHSLTLQRLLFAVANPGSGAAVKGLGENLKDYLGDTSVFAGKYLSDSVFAHASARLTSEPLVPLQMFGVGLDSEVGVDFETPFGLLQWTFQPKHPEQLFIDDQSFNLTWKLSL
jgi:hypothetical protein